MVELVQLLLAHRQPQLLHAAPQPVASCDARACAHGILERDRQVKSAEGAQH